MKATLKLLALAMLCWAIVICLITACGGGAAAKHPGGNTTASRLDAFIWTPVHLLSSRVTQQSAGISNSSPFVVNAQTATPTIQNLQGVCNATAPSSGRAATVLFNLGRWSHGACDDAQTPDSDIGVTVPHNGQVGNLVVDAVGTGTGADSGQIEFEVISSSTGAKTIIPVTCTLAVSPANSKVHCEDRATGHFTNINAGDQVVVRFFYNAGDAYRGIRVTAEYATPTF